MCSFPAIALSLTLSMIIGFVLDVDQFLYGLVSMHFLVTLQSLYDLRMTYRRINAVLALITVL